MSEASVKSGTDPFLVVGSELPVQSMEVDQPISQEPPQPPQQPIPLHYSSQIQECISIPVVDKLEGVYFCYLLKSENDYMTYIGYTTNLHRRIRQHNGEIVGGAKKTRKHRPWKIVCCLTGFPTSRSGLQYEWFVNHSRKRKIADRIARMIQGTQLKWTSPPIKNLKLKWIWFADKYTPINCSWVEEVKYQPKIVCK